MSINEKYGDAISQWLLASVLMTVLFVIMFIIGLLLCSDDIGNFGFPLWVEDIIVAFVFLQIAAIPWSLQWVKSKNYRLKNGDED